VLFQKEKIPIPHFMSLIIFIYVAKGVPCVMLVYPLNMA
jgi:hypothetical protein